MENGLWEWLMLEVGRQPKFLQLSRQKMIMAWIKLKVNTVRSGYIRDFTVLFR